jgi:hypothetical protein
MANFSGGMPPSSYGFRQANYPNSALPSQRHFGNTQNSAGFTPGQGAQFDQGSFIQQRPTQNQPYQQHAYIAADNAPPNGNYYRQEKFSADKATSVGNGRMRNNDNMAMEDDTMTTTQDDGSSDSCQGQSQASQQAMTGQQSQASDGSKFSEDEPMMDPSMQMEGQQTQMMDPSMEMQNQQSQMMDPSMQMQSGGNTGLSGLEQLLPMMMQMMNMMMQIFQSMGFGGSSSSQTGNSSSLLVQQDPSLLQDPSMMQDPSLLQDPSLMTA